MHKPMNRRHFLAQSTVAGAALSGWTALSSTSAAEGKGDKVRIGVMGTNGRGHALATEFAELPTAEVVYVCDVDRRAVDKTVGAVAKVQPQAPQGVGDFRRILDDAHVDALVVAAPDHWHAPATLLACAAGKHVYVEKPASHNPREGELMVEAARKHNRVVQVGTQRRSSPSIAEGLQRMRDGEIGRVLFARGWINSTRPSIGHGQTTAVPEWLDYDLWQGPAPEVAYRDNLIHYHWHWFWNWGTGELGNNGVHSLDLIRWGMGLDFPARVTCAGGKYFFDDDQQSPDTQLATYHFGDRAITWEHRTWHRRGFEDQSWGVTFYGDQGSLIVGGNELAIQDMAGKQIDRFSINRGEIEHLQNFVDCIRNGDRPNCDIEEGAKSALLCHLGNIAYRTGRTVNCDPTNGHIVGDEEQAQLWSREYRHGWEPRV